MNADEFDYHRRETSEFDLHSESSCLLGPIIKVVQISSIVNRDNYVVDLRESNEGMRTVLMDDAS